MDKVIKLIDQIENIDELDAIIQHAQKKLNNSKAINLASKILSSKEIKKLTKKQQKFASNIKSIERNVELVDYHMSTETIFYIDDIKCAEYYNGTNDGEGIYSFEIGELLISRYECSCIDISYDDLDDDIKDQLNDLFDEYDITVEECYNMVCEVMNAVMKNEWKK